MLSSVDREVTRDETVTSWLGSCGSGGELPPLTERWDRMALGITGVVEPWKESGQTLSSYLPSCYLTSAQVEEKPIKEPGEKVLLLTAVTVICGDSSRVTIYPEEPFKEKLFRRAARRSSSREQPEGAAQSSKGYPRG